MISGHKYDKYCMNQHTIIVWFVAIFSTNIAQLLYGQIYRNCSEIVVKS